MRAARLICWRDLEDAVRNSTFLLVLIGPVLCSILFFQVGQRGDFARPTLGVVGSTQEGLGLVLSLSDALRLETFSTVHQGREALEQGQLDGLLELELELSEQLATGELPTVLMQVRDPESTRTVLLRTAIEEAARAVAAQDLPIDLRIVSAMDGLGEDRGWRERLLPAWLVFTAMSGLMVCSASVVEEKEHRTFLGVLTAPVNMVQLWVGKVSAGGLLALASTVAVLLGNAVIPSLTLLFHLVAGCLCFAALGVLVGLLCSNQSAANAATSTLFMVIYIPLALQDLSDVLSRAVLFSPAFYLQRGTAAFLAEQGMYGWRDLAALAVFLLLFASLGLVALRHTKSLLGQG